MFWCKHTPPDTHTVLAPEPREGEEIVQMWAVGKEELKYGKTGSEGRRNQRRRERDWKEAEED